MYRLISGVVLIIFLLPSIVQSKSMQSNYDEIISQLESVGTAKFSVLFWDIYQSALYTANGRYDQDKPEQPILFHIQYLRDIKAQELIEKTAEQWRHIGLSDNQFASFLPQLKSIWPNISEGDSLSLYVDNGVSYFYFNRQLIGQIDEKTFGSLFLDIWLSPKTSQPELRKQLIGETS